MPDMRFMLCSADGKWQRELLGVVQVGRGRTDGVALTDDGVSRQHATLTVENDTVLLEDMKSLNGTYVNGTRIIESYKLRPGDRIRFHTQEYELKRIESLENSLSRTLRPTKNLVSIDDAAAAKRGPSWMASLKMDESNKTTLASLEKRKELGRLEKERQEANMAAPPVTQPCLFFERYGNLVATIPLAAGSEHEQEWYIGRQDGCDVLVDDPSVSGVQAKILRSGLQWYVLDAISMNGTFVNDMQVGKQYLKSGDLIRFGSVDALFRLPPQANPRRKKFPQKRHLVIAAGVCVLIAAAFVLKKYL